MNWKNEWKYLLWMVVIFAGIFFMPIQVPRVQTAIMESLALAKWYAREHVLLCLIPAFFIAGAVAVVVSQGTVMKYLGPNAKKWLAYGVASASGTSLRSVLARSCRYLLEYTAWERGLVQRVLFSILVQQ